MYTLSHVKCTNLGYGVLLDKFNIGVTITQIKRCTLSRAPQITYLINNQISAQLMLFS